MAAPARRGRRRTAFALVTTLLAVLLAEYGGRALGPTPPPLPGVARATATTLDVGTETTILRQGPDRRQDARVPTRAGARPRVVVLGESSVRGAAGSDARSWFPERLADRAPDLEVLNLGAPGQSLAGILRIFRALGPLEPDLVVVYAGHNEFSHPIFAGDVTGSRLWLLPVYDVLGRSWLLGMVSDLLRTRAYLPPPPRPGTTPSWVYTDDSSLLTSRPAVLTRFRADLSAIVDESPAPMLLTTLLRNFDHGPTGVLFDGKRDSACRQALPPGPHVPPTDSRAVSAACGDESAVARWNVAHAARARGDDAASAWRESLARDPLPLRAPLEADDLIREIATERKVPLVDLARALGPYPEGRLFTDTLHPSPAGAQAIAEALEPSVRAALGRPKVVSP